MPKATIPIDLILLGLILVGKRYPDLLKLLNGKTKLLKLTSKYDLNGSWTRIYGVISKTKLVLTLNSKYALKRSRISIHGYKAKPSWF